MTFGAGEQILGAERKFNGGNFRDILHGGVHGLSRSGDALTVQTALYFLLLPAGEFQQGGDFIEFGKNGFGIDGLASLSGIPRLYQFPKRLSRWENAPLTNRNGYYTMKPRRNRTKGK